MNSLSGSSMKVGGGGGVVGGGGEEIYFIQKSEKD